MAQTSIIQAQFRTPDTEIDRLPFGGPVLAALGDSISDNGISDTFYSSGNYRTINGNNNYLSWVRFLTQQRVYHPIAHNLGIAGQTLPQIVARLPDLFALRPTPNIVIFQGGTNDMASAVLTPLARMQALFLQAATAILGAGMLFVCFPILPRGSPNGVTTTAYQKINAYNNWMRRWSMENASHGVVYVDPNPYLTNYADADGSPISGYFHDGLHTSSTGAYWLGKAIADALTPYLGPQEWKGMHPRDYYDATNNPQGNLIFSGTANQGRMSGTGGTATSTGSFTASGSIADGWTLTRAAGGSSTSTGVGSKENPRTDGPNSGERQVIALAVSVAGGTAEVFTLKPTSITIGTNVQIGDIIYATAKVEIAAGAIGLAATEFQFSEFGGNVGVLTQEMSRVSGETLLMPTLTSPIVGVLRSPLHVVGGDGRAGPKSPNNTTISYGFNFYMDTTVSTPGATIKISDVAVRKFTGV